MLERQKNITVGYKYIFWDVGVENADIYERKAKTGDVLRYSELTDMRGMEDKEELPGIYFCKTLEDLHVWVKEALKWIDPFALEILEITPVEEVEERRYANGRIAYVTPACMCRILEDREYPVELREMIGKHFN
jgi:hypothetical protein